MHRRNNCIICFSIDRNITENNQKQGSWFEIHCGTMHVLRNAISINSVHLCQRLTLQGDLGVFHPCHYPHRVLQRALRELTVCHVGRMYNSQMGARFASNESELATWAAERRAEANKENPMPLVIAFRYPADTLISRPLEEQDVFYQTMWPQIIKPMTSYLTLNLKLRFYTHLIMFYTKPLDDIWM